jgi:two-component system KDP operon response regulator KdpE
MTHQKILLIDDDSTLCQLLAEHLQTAGFIVITAGDGPQGLYEASQAQPDLIVLDLMMPGMDGWEVCQHLRAASSVPIIMLTAKSEEIDKLRGFRLGVDDYVTKPFSFAELVARVRAVLSRVARPSASEHLMKSGDFTIDFDQHRVTVAGQVVELTRTEYRLLEALTQHAHRTVSTEWLVEKVWGPAYSGEVEQVKHFIWTLRKKIEIDPGDPKHLITERGFGYRFE